MNCPDCGHDNLQNKNFCTKCGSRLPLGPVKWYFKKSFINTLLILSFLFIIPIPFVLILLWTSPEFNKRSKIFASGILLLWMVSLISLGIFSIYRTITKFRDENSNIARVWLTYPHTGEIKKLVERKNFTGWTYVEWVPKSHKLFLSTYSGFSCKVEIIDAYTGSSKQLDFPVLTHSFSWSPDGTKVVCNGQDASGEIVLYMCDIKEGNIRKIPTPSRKTFPFLPSFTFLFNPEWSSSGDRIAYRMSRFTSINNKLAVFDLKKGEETILDDIYYGNEYSWCPEGERLAHSKSYENKAFLTISEMEGETGLNKRILEWPGNITSFKWSPRGDKISFCSSKGEREGLWILNVEDMKALLLSIPIDSSTVSWSSGGEKIAFSTSCFTRERDTAVTWKIMRYDGKGEFEIKSYDRPVFSPADDSIVYVTKKNNEGLLCSLDLKDGITDILLKTSSTLYLPDFSLDGNYIAYIAWSPIRQEYLVCVYDLKNRREREVLPVSRTVETKWSYDGKILEILSIQTMKKMRENSCSN